MFKPTSIFDKLLTISRRDVDAFLDSLADYFSVRWYPSYLRGKKGVSVYSDSVEMKMLIRTADEARSSDLILGIVLTGSHVGVASYRHSFKVGDVITSSTGISYEIVSVHKKTGGLYWIIDMNQALKEDIGEVL